MTTSNLCALWELEDEAAEIEFYYDEVKNVCLHLVENLVEAKQVMNQLPTLVKRLLDQLKRGIICPSISPYSASISVVQKKDRSIRICSAPIGLNAAIIDDGQLLPNMRELMDTIVGAKFYSLWNLISRFWQIEIEKRNKAKTAFSTLWGYYKYNVMPFRLKGMLATF